MIGTDGSSVVNPARKSSDVWSIQYRSSTSTTSGRRPASATSSRRSASKVRARMACGSTAASPGSLVVTPNACRR